MCDVSQTRTTKIIVSAENDFVNVFVTKPHFLSVLQIILPKK
jgi:hypothetical protein